MNTAELMTQLQTIRLLICDVDGVLTDGRITYDNDGRELKSFHAQDGLGLKLLQRAGIEVAIITARESAIVSKRMSELGIKHVYQGARRKHEAYLELLTLCDCKPNQVAYIGDDLPDLIVMREVGLAVTVANGNEHVKANAMLTLRKQGGCGAVREFCDLLLHAQEIEVETLL